MVTPTIAAVVFLLWRPQRIETYYTTGRRHKAGPAVVRQRPPDGEGAHEVQVGDPLDQVDVTLSRGFWLGKYEVTQGEYRGVVNDGPSSFRAGLAAGVDLDKLPVESV